jgi:hypothetical protein
MPSSSRVSVIATSNLWLVLWIVSDYVKTNSFLVLLYAWITRRDFLYGVAVCFPLTSRTIRDLKILWFLYFCSSYCLKANTPCIIRPSTSFLLAYSNSAPNVLIVLSYRSFRAKSKSALSFIVKKAIFFLGRPRPLFYITFFLSYTTFSSSVTVIIMLCGASC